MEQIGNQTNQVLTPFQIQILELTSRVKSIDEQEDIRKMLADYLLQKAEAKQKPLKYPKLPKGYKVSDETMRLAAGKMRDNFDLDYELEKMHEELAK